MKSIWPVYNKQHEFFNILSSIIDRLDRQTDKTQCLMSGLI